MQLPSLPFVFLSSLIINVVPSLSEALPPVPGAPSPLAPAPAPPPPKQGIIQNIKSAVGLGGPPPDLLQYQKDQAKKLEQRCRDLRNQALKDPKLPVDIRALSANDMKYSYPALSSQGFKKGKGTVFTHYGKTRHERDNIMHSTPYCHVIMNGKSPFRRSYIDQHEAGQSFLHFLVIPRKNVYNGVVFTDDFWIRKSREAFREFHGKKDWHEKATSRVHHYIKHALPHSKNEADFAALKKQSKGLKVSDFAEAYHTGVDASVSHLHMHVVAAPAPLRVLSSGLHDEKDVPPDTLMAVVKADGFGAAVKDWQDPKFRAAAMNKGRGGGGRKKKSKSPGALGKVLNPQHHKRSAVSRRAAPRMHSWE